MKQHGAYITINTKSGLKTAMINFSDYDSNKIFEEEDIDVVCKYITQFSHISNRTFTFYSLNSKDNGFNCKAFAQYMGGDGNTIEAEFYVPYVYGRDPLEYFHILLSEWVHNNSTMVNNG